MGSDGHRRWGLFAVLGLTLGFIGLLVADATGGSERFADELHIWVWLGLGFLALNYLFFKEWWGRKNLEDSRFQLTNAVGEGLVLTDLDNRITYVNPAAAALLGYTPEEALELSVADVVHPEDLPGLAQQSATQSDQIRVRLAHRDGGYISVEAHAVPYYRQGKPIGHITAVRDLSAQLESQGQITRLNRLLQGVNEASQVLLSQEAPSKRISSALEKLVQATDSSRGLLFEYHPHPQTAEAVSSLRFLWTQPSFPLDPGPLVNRSLDRPGGVAWVGVFEQGQVISGNIRSFPLEEKLTMGQYGVRSTLKVPVWTGGKLWGYLGLDDCVQERQWQDEEIAVLKTAARILGEAIQRFQAEQSLRESEGRYRDLYVQGQIQREEVQRLNGLLQGATQISRLLLLSEHFDSVMTEALEVLGQATGIERVYLLRFSQQGSALRLRCEYEWSSAKVEAGWFQQIFSDIPADPNWYGLLQEGEAVALGLKDLPSPIQGLIEPTGARWFLDVPIFVHGQLCGLLGFAQNSQQSWNPQEIAVIKGVAMAFGEALQRTQFAAELKQNEQRYRELFEQASAAQKRTEHFNQLLEGVAQVNQRLLSLSSTNEAYGPGWSAASPGQGLSLRCTAELQAVLAELGQTLRTERVHLLALYPTKEHQHPQTPTLQPPLHLEWTAMGVPSLAQNPVLVKLYLSQKETLQRGQSVQIPGIEANDSLHLVTSTSVLAIPIFVGGELWGVLGCDDTHLRSWSNQELVVLQNIAANLGTTLQRLAIETRLRSNEQRYRDLALQHQRQADELRLMLEIRQVLSTQTEPSQIYQAAVEVVSKAFGYAMVSIYLQQGQELVMQHQVGYQNWLPRVPMGEGVMARCVQGNRAILIEDARSDPNFVYPMNDVISEVAVPLQVQGQVIGVLNIESRFQHFRPKDLELLQAVADQLNLVIERSRLMTAALEQQQLYRTLVENVPDGVVLFGKRGLVYANPSALQTLGFASLEEARGRHYGEFRLESSRLSPEVFIKVMQGEPLALTEEQIRNAKGERVDLEMIASPASIGGRRMGLLTWRDITEAKKVQAIIQRGDARYRAVVDTSPDAIWMVDEQLNYTFVNQRFMEIIKATVPEQVIGSSCLRFVVPQHRKRSERILRGLLRHPHTLPATQLEHLNLDCETFEAEVRLTRIVDPNTGKPSVLGITRDITDRTQAEAALRASETRYRSLFEGMPVGLYRSTPEGQILEANTTLLRMLGYDDVESLRQVNSGGLYADPREREVRPAGPTPKGREIRMRRKDGSIFWVEDLTRPVLDQGGQMQYHEGSLQDITERKAYQAQIEHLAYHDALTGLPNRRLLREQAESLIAQANRAGREAALIYFDLDHFKEINDTLGHDAGDILLRQVAVRIGTIIRAGDTLARLGGDEFAILLADADEAGAAEAARRVLDILREPIKIAGESVRISSSVGIALMPRDGSSLEPLMRAADIAMYRAKQQRGSFAFYSVDADPYTRERLQLISELREAIHQDQLVLHYQPILDLESGQMKRIEALCRWPHPVRGLISPGVFIPLAEETGLIDELDRYVLRKALQEMADSGLEVNVNLSARTLHDPHLVEWVQRIVEQSGCLPHRVWLEITETALMKNLDQASSHIQALKKLGLRLALDDFGTGYSSMAYIKHLHLDVIKLDRTFVSGIEQDSRDESVIKAIVSLSEGLNVRVLAEGVETEEQLLWLRQNGCDLAQGYHIARPMSKEKLLEFLGIDKAELVRPLAN